MLVYTGVLHAQLNESDSMKLQLRSSLTGNYQDGNVAVLTVRSRIDVSVRPSKNIAFKSQNSILYQEFSGKKADDDLYSRNYFYLAPQKKIYPFAIGYVATNFRRKISLRYFAGAGVTWQVINKPGHVVKFSASTVYESNSFNSNTFNYTEYNGADKIKLWRGTVYMGGWSFLFQKKLRIYYDAYWQPSFKRSNNYRIQFDTGIDWPVWKGLAVSALYTYTHENLVVKNIRQDDKILTWGLTYGFKTK